MVADSAHNPTPDELRRDLGGLASWRASHLRGDEKSEAQTFLDRLFRAYGHGGIQEAGATLEYRIKKRDVGQGAARGTAFADLMWKPRCLIEMKKAGSDLGRHYRQAFEYWMRAVPDRPRYVILCNFDEFWVYDFDAQLEEPVDRVSLKDLPVRWDTLSFLLPHEGKPIFANDLVEVTREAAAKVARVFSELRARGITRNDAQRFTLQTVMAMFAEDIGLLPGHVFTSALDDSLASPRPAEAAYENIFGLFREMNTPGSTPGGRYKHTPYFNGGLFADVAPFEVSKLELVALREAANTDWSAVRPEIFGTLFEQSMASGERHAYGAHFTSQADIARIVIPTIVAPWRERIAESRTRGRGGVPAMNKLLVELSQYRVLDPACGSGNFLYVAYRELRRIEHEILQTIAELAPKSVVPGQGGISYVHAGQFFGIDRNPFAVEVAKVTMMLGKKLAADELGDYEEILPLENLDANFIAADALFTPWPKADAIVGNPPYLGRRKMAEELGTDYTQRLAAEFPTVGGVSDFVCYWFPLTHDNLPPGGRAGLVATNSIRQNESRAVSLDYVVDHGGIIYDAVSSKPWSGDAVVHVSIVNWIKPDDSNPAPTPKTLWLNEGELLLELDHIPPALTASIDVRKAAALESNQNPAVCFQGQTPGVTKGYVIDSEAKARLIASKGGSEVIHPYLGGKPMLQQVEVDRWIIDIADSDLLEAQTKYPAVMKHLADIVLPERERLLAREEERNAKGSISSKFKPEAQHRLFMNRWWQQWRRRPELINSLSKIDRYIATSRVATFNRASVFQFVDSSIHPGDALTVFTLDDDYSLGILSSAVHRVWLEARCSTFKGDPRYTTSTVWDSFPWPQAPSTDDVADVTSVVSSLLEIRAGYLSQGITLAKQYDALRQPGKSKLREIHSELDQAVLKTYGFSEKEDLLSQLFALNQDLAMEPRNVRGPGGHNLMGARTTNYRLKMNEL
ncbi:DNA modification methyltransferase [Lentzea pudingi]|uniref:site-specific DNA-methyltransferase (adenine-specific) n=1 Tax=Lentzea pudingi TaxID=1789439 RepID=A0ABQ2IUL4_9PSEU|nr:DNA methyltransferase [Lentzea pudingi]GGN25704.1 DNA modification methyltransferase [Lentzea pudingi]